MSKTITISDEAYNTIKQSAEANGRSLTKELDILLSQCTSASGHSGTSGHTPLKDPALAGDDEDEECIPGVIPKAERRVFTKDELHTVTIPSVDTSQPEERTTPHKRWVPTTPEELEAELEKVHRGEREL